MAEEFLHEIFSYAECISQLEELSYYAYTQDPDTFSLGYNKLVNRVWELGDEKIRATLTDISSSQDVIFLADRIRDTLLPRLRAIVGDLAQIQVEVNEKYDICSTQSGYLTLYDKEHRRYLHSMDSPMEVARLTMTRLYNPEKDAYRMWGIGLGYELLQMYRISCGSVVIDVYEPDALIFECARLYGVLSEIPEENVRYHIGEEALAEEFLSEVNNLMTGYYFHLPSLYAMPEGTDKAELLKRAVYQGALVMHERTFPVNVRANLNSNAPFAEEFIKTVTKKDIVVVAAGPSLDDNMERLKECQGKVCIFAVGTVARKLLRAGIVPDAFFANDPQEMTSHQFDGIWDAGVPLVLDTVAHFYLTKKYQGPKYLAWTKAGELYRPTLYSKLLPQPMSSYGTVTGFTLDMAIRCRAERIYLVGVDLAYPTDKSHAEGTPLNHTVSHGNMHPIPSNGGGKVMSTEQFDTYRNELERTICSHPEIRFFNTSRVGARIEGAVPAELIF